MTLSVPPLIGQALENGIGFHRIARGLHYQHAYMFKILVNPWRFFARHSWLDDNTWTAPESRPHLEELPLSQLVGRGVKLDHIGARKELVSVTCHSMFSELESVPFVYEKLGQTANRVVRGIVDEWITEPENVRRAATAIGKRGLTADPQVRAFCGFRFKGHSSAEGMYPVEGLAARARRDSIVIIVALEDMNQRNGCFVTLEKGEKCANRIPRHWWRFRSLLRY